MKYLKEKDKKRRELQKHSNFRRLVLKHFLNQSFIKNYNVFYDSTHKFLQRVPFDSNPIRIQNRCSITGRSHGVHRKFKLSRILIRELSLMNRLCGVKKSSW